MYLETRGSEYRLVTDGRKSVRLQENPEGVCWTEEKTGNEGKSLRRVPGRKGWWCGRLGSTERVTGSRVGVGIPFLSESVVPTWYS